MRKRTRFTEEQIITVLKEAEAGPKTGDLARRHGVSEATIYNWKAKYGGLEVSESRGGYVNSEPVSARTRNGLSCRLISDRERARSGVETGRQ